jgi:hypothetical protein
VARGWSVGESLFFSVLLSFYYARYEPIPPADSAGHPPQTIQAVLTLYQQAASPEFFDQLGAELKLHFHNGVYTLVVVIWLIVWR